MTSIGNLYSKSHLVRLTNSKQDDKFKTIQITVDYQTSIQPTHKTELIIKLTDQQDPFFLYSLFMSEEDFQTLKIEQGLLVDFSAFGQRFIDLLGACEKDERSDSPKFQLQFYSKEPLPFDHGDASLNVIEINPFKHLYHLSLNFMPGNDADVKKYLATCLQTLRDDYTRLTRVHEETKQSLSQKLDSSVQSLAQKSMEFEKLKIEQESQQERLQTKYMQEMNFERDKSMQNQFAAQQRWEKEKKELEMGFAKTTKQMEVRISELESTNKELMEKKYKNEAMLQELRVKNSTLADELGSVKAELASTRKQNSSMDSELHGSEKLLNQLRTRVAVVEQELKDKMEAINRQQETLNSEQEKRKQSEETLKEKQAELKKKQAEINHYVQEFKKGNEVVIKLQAREKSLVSQVKLKTRILNEQEKVMKEREREIEEMRAEIRELKTQVSDSSGEVRDLKATLQKKSVELDEAAKLLKRDENIISWLNKQITDNNLASSGKLVSYEGGVGSGGSGGLFKPFGALSLANNSHSPMSNTNEVDSILHSNGMNGILRSTALGASHLSQTQFMNKTSATNNTLEMDNRRLMLSNGSQLHMYSNSGAGSTNTYQNQHRALSSSSSSSIQHADPLKENNENESKAFEINLHGNGSSTSGRLDPKYFQSHQTAMSDVVKPMLKTNGIRINKQLVTGSSSASQMGGQVLTNLNGTSNGISGSGCVSTSGMPSLASAYFPSN